MNKPPLTSVVEQNGYTIKDLKPPRPASLFLKLIATPWLAPIPIPKAIASKVTRVVLKNFSKGDEGLLRGHLTLQKTIDQVSVFYPSSFLALGEFYDPLRRIREELGILLSV